MSESANTTPASSNTGMAVLCYLGILFIIPLLTDAKNDSFVKFHLKQGIALFIVEVVGAFVGVVPMIGWMLAFLVWPASLVLMIMGILNAVSGKTKELPGVGQIAQSLNF